ncbi:MAG: site-2 protease family protein [Candidatus Zixiibacteriota bacterium]
MKATVTESVLNDIVSLVNRYLAVDGYYVRRDEVNIRGSLENAGADWQPQLRAELASLGYTLRAQETGAMVHLNIYPSGNRIPWLNIILFVVTAISVSIVPGLFTSGTLIFTDLSVFLHWQKFAIPLLLILLFHEFGHYLAARRRGIRVSLPYFLPAPTLIGTFGAFIKSNSPFPSRRDLLEVGAYGPIAGFVVAVIVMAIALGDITYRQTPINLPAAGSLIEPLIMRFLEAVLWNHPAPAGYDVYFQDNPMIFAAWVGLVVTALNLLPVGQLDGGHIIYALSPRYHYLVSRLVFAGMVGFGFYWEGWWFWAAMIFFVIRFKHPPTLNDYEPLDRQSRWIGWTAIAIFILTFSPAPF